MPPRVPDIARLRGWPAVVEAYAAARRLRDAGAPFVVAVCRGGELLATGELGSFSQFRKFSNRMRALGHSQVILGTSRQMFGCDMVYVLDDQEGAGVLSGAG